MISSRIKEIASFIKESESVADVGCDHAYVSIKLKKENVASRVIAMDVREGPLEIARRRFLLARAPAW